MVLVLYYFFSDFVRADAFNYLQIRKGASGHDVTFIHPKGNEQSPIGGCGVLIELVQAPKEVIDASS